MRMAAALDTFDTFSPTVQHKTLLIPSTISHAVSTWGSSSGWLANAFPQATLPEASLLDLLMWLSPTSMALNAHTAVVDHREKSISGGVWRDLCIAHTM
jgi:hypothetical protein